MGVAASLNFFMGVLLAKRGFGIFMEGGIARIGSSYFLGRLSEKKQRRKEERKESCRK